MKNVLKEFEEFAVKGNAMDLAVGVVIGAAFNGIVNSLVSDIINPAISLLTGRIDFSNRFFDLSLSQDFNTIADAKAAGVATLNYGLFINNLINFLIISFTIFMIVRFLNKLRRKGEKEDVTIVIK